MPDIEKLEQEIEFLKATNQKLIDKMRKVLEAQDACRKNNNKHMYLTEKWKQERELQELINPDKAAKQTTINWLAQ